MHRYKIVNKSLLQLQKRWQSYFTLCGEKKPSLKKLRMRQLSTCSNGPGILSCVIIIVASLYCQFLGRSLQEFYFTDWMNILNSQGFYQRTEEQLTWSSQQCSFKRNARNRTWTSAWFLLTLPKHLIQSVLRVFGKLWQSLAVWPSS